MTKSAPNKVNNNKSEQNKAKNKVKKVTFIVNINCEIDENIDLNYVFFDLKGEPKLNFNCNSVGKIINYHTVGPVVD